MISFQLSPFDHKQLLDNTINSHNKITTLQFLLLQQPAQQKSIQQQITLLTQEIQTSLQYLKSSQIHQIQVFLLMLKQQLFEIFDSDKVDFRSIFSSVSKDFNDNSCILREYMRDAYFSYNEDLAQVYGEIIDSLEQNFREICEIVHQIDK
ncbi:hypothetical protein SS50377_23233 [Spironucleus salmonicida]|uniref:Uncharacterized protein n=1 Tax=Spironucleus salmonicida TaxID=348837 RepID=A0A9P8LX35_9EUKA|nr:hypothetical protein SS50377_23233 [Spironucleus salmonicida]